MFINEAGWVAIGFFVFILIAWRFGARPISDFLDQRGNQIKEKLQEAKNLRNEANELLNKYKQLKLDAEKEAIELINKAENTVKQMTLHAEKMSKETIKQKETQVINKIKGAETQALLDIKNLTIELAIKSSEDILASKLSDENAKTILEDSVKKLN